MDEHDVSRFRPELGSAGRIIHGGRGIQAGTIDFSVCVNPFPLPRQVEGAIMSADFSRYPDAEASLLKERIAEMHNCGPSEILVCNGISQAIFLVAFTLLDRGRRTLIIGPTYGEYEKNCRIMGTEIIRYECSLSKGFHPVIDDLRREIRRTAPSVVWLCNPNNPTGILLPLREIEDIAEICNKSSATLVVDEAYMNFVAEEERHTIEADNVIVMRSMTKDFAVPGLRLGYVRARPETIRLLRAAQPEWSLNAPALAAGIAALHSLNEYRDQWNRLRQETETLAENLRNLRFDVFPGRANFLLIRDTLRGGIDGRRFRGVLREEKMVLRDCASFGLEGYMRIGTSLPENNRKLVEALGKRDLWGE